MKVKNILFVLLAALAAVLAAGCGKKAAKPKELTILLHMLPNQEIYFRNDVLNEFEKLNNCKINIVKFEQWWDIETMLMLQKEKKDPNIFLVKVPFEMTRVLAGKGLMEPLDTIIAPDVLERDMAEYHPLALGLGYIDNKPFYIPRKLETRLIFYLKSKVDEAVKNWKKDEKELNKLLKKQNGYGLPKGYELEAEPEKWDLYDIFVMGWYWAHQKYFNTNVFMPRIAHRADRYEGTALGLVDQAIQFGGSSDDILRMDAEPVMDMFLWEAVFVKNKIFNPDMWNESWRGSNIYDAIKDGKVFLTVFQQIDCFLVHGWEESPEMPGYLKDPEDMGVATMPLAVSFELNPDGTYKKVGSKKISTGGWWWGIPKTSPDKALAYQLARFVTNRDNQSVECSKFGMIPVRKDIINNLSDAFELG
ncbi:MAG: ABC transporter substrate-binding protein, partial [Syntrophaceae bacterium]